MGFFVNVTAMEKCEKRDAEQRLKYVEIPLKNKDKFNGEGN